MIHLFITKVYQNQTHIFNLIGWTGASGNVNCLENGIKTHFILLIIINLTLIILFLLRSASSNIIRAQNHAIFVRPDICRNISRLQSPKF